ncbi:hypothetical protein BLA23254_05962 [Burkholderia lata]|uniref:Uncharacterized protein n=1 Tax=Burkholderia lata (strain ATCC 17760 / DSM 23089 / LMG 22485 / NCIMB 9086 / R18194 / 383) TaxID=482957 RepID=A0A6P2QP06_BURL3|nr:hypothetical protein BLA23254_05962 [Burkholderia lata]
MLSCRSVKGNLIFVSVLMHRETNLQVENEETIEAQSARTPKRCWTESNSAFSFACTDFRRWCIGLLSGRIPRLRSHRVSSAILPRFAASLRFPVSHHSFVRRRRSAVRWPFGLTRLACAKRVRYTRLSPTARSGKSVGSSPTSRMQKREYGWMSSAGRWFGAGRAAGAVRSSWGGPVVAEAFPSRPAACRHVPVPSPVVACASVSGFRSACA